MDPDSAWVWIAEVIIADFKELLDNGIGRGRTVDKEQIIMGYSSFGEVLFFVLGLVQPNDSRYVELFEDIDVLAGVMAVPLLLVSLLDGSHEGHEFSGDDPVDVSVLNSFVVLVLLDVEQLVVIPIESDRVLEPLEALEQSALVEAIALTGISVRLEEGTVSFEGSVGLLGGDLHEDDHEAGHEECAIDHLVGFVGAAVMEYPKVSVILIFQ